MNLVNILSSLPAMSHKQVLKSMIGGLNASIIGYVRGHIRNSKFENISRSNEEPTIDAYNEALSEMSENAADQQSLRDMGLAVQITAIDAAQKLNSLRVTLIEQLSLLQTHPNDVPLTIGETIDFQIKNQPKINEPVLKALASACGLDIETLKAARIKMHNDDRNELLDMMGQIVDIAKELANHPDNVEDIDDAFTSLPAFMQYRVINLMSRSIKKSGDQALQTMLRYNRLESAGDIQLIKAVHADLFEQFTEFAKANMNELTEYTERGGQLAEITPL